MLRWRLAGLWRGWVRLRRRWMRALKQYRFDEAANAVYQFFWGDLCDWYLEMVKVRLEFGEGADLVATRRR